MKNYPICIIVLLFSFLGWSGCKLIPEKKEKSTSSDHTFAFYNVENLFDLIDNPRKNDDEFLPEGDRKWDQRKFSIKLNNLARVISEMGDPDGPEILGLAEIENKDVIEALVNTTILKDKNYGIVHYESMDARGIDVALIYKKDVFTPLYSQNHTPKFENRSDLFTRDILHVRGKYCGKEHINFIVNHWPSRRAGKEESEFKRIRTAEVSREIVEGIWAQNRGEKIVVMGDFNDEPGDPSLLSVLKAERTAKNAEKLQNLMFPQYDSGKEGSLMYNREWDIFDNFIISGGFLQPNGGGALYIDSSAAVYNPVWITVPGGKYQGAPKRTFGRNGFFEDCYSDHFPVYMRISCN